MMSKKLPFLLLLLCGAIAANAQNISSGNFLWTVSQAMSANDTAPFNYACTFTTKTTATLDWSQGNGQSVTHYTVTSVDGQWPDISTDGQVTYHVENGAITGTIQFQRTGGVPKIHLELMVSGKPDQDYIFSVSAITPAN